MGVPQTPKEYAKYLKKQMLRRRKERAIKKKENIIKRAAPYMQAKFSQLKRQVKGYEAIAEKGIMKANIHWRRNTQLQKIIKDQSVEIQHLKTKLAQERKEQQETKKGCTKNQCAEIQHLRAKLVQERKEQQETKKECTYYWTKKVLWSNWWERVRARASPKTLSLIYKLGRPPRCTDRDGPHGSQ